MERRYENLLKQHLTSDRQMAFVSGPRQIGKTTSCTSIKEEHAYFNWDNEDHRSLILAGPAAIVAEMGLSGAYTLVFDELHKYPDWRNFIKGLYDTYSHDDPYRIIVTGSARLDIYRKGADSLLGRYFIYRMHPLSIGEIAHTHIPQQHIMSPRSISDADFDALLRFGGFPDPFLRRNVRFHNRWKRMRQQLLLRQDIRDTTRIYEVGQVELLAEFLRQQAGQLSNVAALATRIRASQDSIRRWLSALESLYYCFSVRPWTRNISRSLLKEPKIYLWDWSTIDDPGMRHENFVASHLLKAVHWWQDTGLGDCGLYFLRTKDKREVDFLVVRDNEPWFLVEVKTGANQPLNKNLAYFQEYTAAPHAFQVILNADFTSADCFELHHPAKVAARTFLSQLI
jgi:hypothetical protein